MHVLNLMHHTELLTLLCYLQYQTLSRTLALGPCQAHTPHFLTRQVGKCHHLGLSQPLYKIQHLHIDLCHLAIQMSKRHLKTMDLLVKLSGDVRTMYQLHSTAPSTACMTRSLMASSDAFIAIYMWFGDL